MATNATPDAPASCSRAECTRPARVAVGSARPTRGGLRTTIHYDDRTAPKAAQRLCKAHGLEIVADLISTLVHDDAPNPAPVTS